MGETNIIISILQLRNGNSVRILRPHFLLTLTRKALMTFPNGALAYLRIRLSFNKVLYNLRSIHDGNIFSRKLSQQAQEGEGHRGEKVNCNNEK